MDGNILLVALVTYILMHVVTIVHELGHLLTGIYFKIPIVLCDCGMGPTIFRLNFKFFIFRIKLIPLSGRTRFIGVHWLPFQSISKALIDECKERHCEHPGLKRSNWMRKKHFLIRFFAISNGPIFNFVMGIAIISFVLLLFNSEHSYKEQIVFLWNRLLNILHFVINNDSAFLLKPFHFVNELWIDSLGTYIFAFGIFSIFFGLCNLLPFAPSDGARILQETSVACGVRGRKYLTFYYIVFIGSAIIPYVIIVSLFFVIVFKLVG